MIIREVDLFHGASEEIQGELVNIMESESYKAGDVIIRAGDPAENFYVVQTGALNVKVEGVSHTTEMAIRPGETVGWSSLAGRATYSAFVECAEPSKVWKVNKDKLDQILRRHPDFGMLFYKRLAGVVGERLILCYQEVDKLKGKSG